MQAIIFVRPLKKEARVKRSTENNENPRSTTHNEVAISIRYEIVSSIIERHGNELQILILILWTIKYTVTVRRILQKYTGNSEHCNSLRAKFLDS